jgi:hypothetical protein
MARDKLQFWATIVGPIVVVILFLITSIMSCSSKETSHTMGIRELQCDVEELNEMHSGICNPEAMRADIDENEDALAALSEKIDALIVGQQEIRTRVELLLMNSGPVLTNRGVNDESENDVYRLGDVTTQRMCDEYWRWDVDPE